jgi:DNA invertase Pin-like site-specific DNA recombinase
MLLRPIVSGAALCSWSRAKGIVGSQSTANPRSGGCDSAGRISAIVVWRIDRIGRTAKGLTALFDDPREEKVNLVSLRDGIDLSTAAGRLMASVLASAAQYETEVRGERVKAGQGIALRRGKRWGGSKPGVRKKVTDIQLRTIHRLKESVERIAEIARTVHLSRPPIYSVLAAVVQYGGGNALIE